MKDFNIVIKQFEEQFPDYNLNARTHDKELNEFALKSILYDFHTMLMKSLALKRYDEDELRLMYEAGSNWASAHEHGAYKGDFEFKKTLKDINDDNGYE